MLEEAMLVTKLAAALNRLAGPSLERVAKRRAVPILGKAPAFLDKVFDETLSRLALGKLENKWWKTVFQWVHFETTKSPDFLRAPTFQEWLQDTTNRKDIRALAGARVQYQDQDRKAIQRLQESLQQYTGETQQIAERIEIVVGLLVADFQIGFSRKDLPLAALQEAYFKATLDELRELKQWVQEALASLKSDASETPPEDQPLEESGDRSKTTPLDRGAHRKKLIAEIESILRDQDVAIGALIEAAKTASKRGALASGWDKIKKGSKAVRPLSEAICDTEIGPMLETLDEALFALSSSQVSSRPDREQQVASETLERLVFKVAPYLAAFKLSLELPDMHGGLFQLPCQTPTVFEMLLAVVEGRETQWRGLSVRGEYPKGRGLLKMPQFEGGAGQELWSFALYLASLMFASDDLPKAFKLKIQPEGEELETAMEELNDQLEGKARRRRQPFRYYLILDKVAREEFDRLRENLRPLPAIWLLQSSGGDKREEMRWCRALSEILFARRGITQTSVERETP